MTQMVFKMQLTLSMFGNTIFPLSLSVFLNTVPPSNTTTVPEIISCTMTELLCFFLIRGKGGLEAGASRHHHPITTSAVHQEPLSAASRLIDLSPASPYSWSLQVAVGVRGRLSSLVPQQPAARRPGPPPRTPTEFTPAELT